MKIIAHLLLALLVFSAFFAVSNGAVWFEGYNPQEPQERVLLNVEHKIPPVSPYTATPVVDLILSEPEPQNVNLNITVTTWALGHQTGNFETWLSIDSKEPEKLSSTLNVKPSAAGEFYERQYNLTLSGLRDGVHLIEIRVVGDYYGPGSGSYDCQGNATFIINDQPLTSPSPSVPEFSWLTILPLLFAIPIVLAVIRKTV